MLDFGKNWQSPFGEVHKTGPKAGQPITESVWDRGALITKGRMSTFRQPSRFPKPEYMKPLMIRNEGNGHFYDESRFLNTEGLLQKAKRGFYKANLAVYLVRKI